jgi:hypothetical protein
MSLSMQVVIGSSWRATAHALEMGLDLADSINASNSLERMLAPSFWSISSSLWPITRCARKTQAQCPFSLEAIEATKRAAIHRLGLPSRLPLPRLDERRAGSRGYCGRATPLGLREPQPGRQSHRTVKSRSC